MDAKSKKKLEVKGKGIVKDFEEEYEDTVENRQCPPGFRPVPQIDPTTGKIKIVCIPIEPDNIVQDHNNTTEDLI